jgi:hypothetical protein
MKTLATMVLILVVVLSVARVKATGALIAAPN